MGMFDTVYVSDDVVGTFALKCRGCAKALPLGDGWQTKELDRCMMSYLLRHDESGAVRLYVLDPPSDTRLWRQWTDEEIEESENEAARGGIFAALRKRRGYGEFLPEAFLPQNRRQRFMGELPHQWVEIYTSCSCDKLTQYWIKFCDGVATEIREKSPRHDRDLGA